jgi:hypothetical protein
MKSQPGIVAGTLLLPKEERLLEQGYLCACT